MKRLAGIVAITASLGWAPMAAGQELAVDLSEEGVAITTGFSGANLLLFGATQGEGDVVVVVYGPTQSQRVRRKENVAGVWVNRKGVTFYNVPAFYTVAASRPLGTILTDLQRLDYQIGADKLTLVPGRRSRAGPADGRVSRGAAAHQKAPEPVLGNNRNGQIRGRAAVPHPNQFPCERPHRLLRRPRLPGR